MSIWGDIRKKSLGQEKRIEDIVAERDAQRESRRKIAEIWKSFNPNKFETEYLGRFNTPSGLEKEFKTFDDLTWDANYKTDFKL